MSVYSSALHSNWHLNMPHMTAERMWGDERPGEHLVKLSYWSRWSLFSVSFFFPHRVLLVSKYNKTASTWSVSLCTKPCENTLKKMSDWLTPESQQQNQWLSLNRHHSRKHDYGVNLPLHWELAGVSLLDCNGFIDAANICGLISTDCQFCNPAHT